MKLTTQPLNIGTVTDLYPEVPAYLGFMSVYRIDDTNYVDAVVSKFLVGKWLIKESAIYTSPCDNKTEIELIAVQDSENQPELHLPRHYGIIRTSYHFVEWVKKDGGGWSLTTRQEERANFTSREHANEVLSDILRIYGGRSWADDTLVVVPIAKDSVKGELPPLLKNASKFVVRLEVEEGYSKYLAKKVEDVGGFYITNDIFEACQFGSYDEALKATEADKRLVVEALTVNDIHYLECTTFVVLRESETHLDGYSVLVTEYLADGCDTDEGWALTTDANFRWEFDTLEEALETIKEIGDKYLVVLPIAPKPLSPTAIASAENLVSDLLRVNNLYDSHNQA